MIKMPLVVRLLPLFLTVAACSGDNVNRRFASGKATEGYGEKILSYFDEDTKARIAEVYAPYGSVTDGQKFSLAASYHTDAADLAKELGLAEGNTLTPLLTPAAIFAAKPDAVAKAITIFLDLPKQPARFWSVFSQKTNYLIVHTTYDPKTAKWKRGVIPFRDMAIRDNRVVLPTDRTGRYELWQVQTPPSHYPKDREIPPPDLRNPPISIAAIRPIVAGTGDTVTVRGKYFTAKTRITVAGKPVKAYKYLNPNTATFKMPPVAFGQAEVRAHEGTRMSRLRMISQADRKDLPVITAPAAEVCQEITYYSIQGVRIQGEKTCSPPICAKGGAVGCASNPHFPAVAKKDIDPKKFLDNLTINGIKGEVKPPKPLPPYCTEIRSKACLTSRAYPAVKSSHIKAENFRKGVAFPGLGITGTFPNKTLPGASAVLDLSQRNFGNALRSTSGIPYQFWDSAGNRHIITGDKELKPENLREQIVVYGVKGVAKEGDLPPCFFTGDANCRARQFDYWAVAKDILNPKNVKKGVKIGSIIGEFPSYKAPMGPVVGEVLTENNFKRMLASEKPFTYFDSAGKAHIAKGSKHLAPPSIREGVIIFGIAGTAKAFSTKNIKPEYIRAGLYVGKVKGTVKVTCRNLGPNRHDTVIDTKFPTVNPWGKHEYVCAHSTFVKVDPPRGAKKRCGGKTSIVNCMFADQLTGLSWGVNSGNWRLPGNRIEEMCTRGSGRLKGPYGGYNDWQAASIDKLMEAFVHGLSYKMGGGLFAQNRNNGFLWTNSSAPGGSGGMVLQIHTGVVASAPHSTYYQSICQRKTGQQDNDDY